MFCYYKYNIIPEERFKNSSNVSLYLTRFKDLANKKFYMDGDRLYYIKQLDTYRLDNGQFVDINKVILKKIPYIYEILPKIKILHEQYGHISFKNLAKKFLETEYYLNGIEIITEEYSKQCAECYSKFFSKKLIKSPKIILDGGPHYRLLVDKTYLDKFYYNGKTKYNYIINCIGHFSKFYWAHLIIDKTAKTALIKIKNFIAINKKPLIIQTDNRLEFRNKLFEEFCKNEGIKHILSRPHQMVAGGVIIWKFINI